jgi:YD repeat-containing protein
MEIKWEPRAVTALENVIRYRYDEAGKLSAERLLRKIDADANRISLNPMIGSNVTDLEGLKYSYRSLVTAKVYKLIYRIEKNTIHIAALFDCRRDPARLLEEVSDEDIAQSGLYEAQDTDDPIHQCIATN